jgi:hypothetical protein
LLKVQTFEEEPSNIYIIVPKLVRRYSNIVNLFYMSKKDNFNYLKFIETTIFKCNIFDFYFLTVYLPPTCLHDMHDHIILT